MLGGDGFITDVDKIVLWIYWELVKLDCDTRLDKLATSSDVSNRRISVDFCSSNVLRLLSKADMLSIFIDWLMVYICMSVHHCTHHSMNSLIILTLISTNFTFRQCFSCLNHKQNAETYGYSRRGRGYRRLGRHHRRRTGSCRQRSRGHRRPVGNAIAIGDLK